MNRGLQSLPRAPEQPQRSDQIAPQSADLREPWITEREAALHCGYPDTARGHKSFREWVRTAGAPCGRIGARLRFKRSRLDWFLTYGQRQRRRIRGVA